MAERLLKLRALASAALAVALTAMPLPSRAQDRSLEYAVKAAYLYKFAPFVEWPPRAFTSPAAPLQLCVLGADPFGSSLELAVNGQRVGGRPVAVRRLQRVDVASGCHILFVGDSRAQSALDAIKAVRGSPTLTVADGGSDIGAIIRFVVRDNRVRFDIDTAAAAANGVTISSKLLSLAMSLRGSGAAS
ncbi:MAG TPA: YfiR family protein [Phenylobacterium sp.]|nr:YfiR family protein [Phenylobacterium sp.]